MADRVSKWLQRKAHMLAALQHETARKTINGGLDLQQVVKMDPAAKDPSDYEVIRGRELTFVGIDESSHIRDAFLYGQSASRMHRVTPKTPLGEYSDADLIMHMLNRGYAVLKCPNQTPEVLRDAED